MSTPTKNSKGPKPNPLTQSKRVWENQLRRDEKIQNILNLEHSGHQSRRELPEVANEINALSGIERAKRLKEEINALREKRQKTERTKRTKTRAGTKRKITTSPIHTDYSTNEGEWIEPGPEKISSFRESVAKEYGPKTNSEIFKATRTAMQEQASKRNSETKSRSQKRAKKQSAPEPKPEVGPLGKIKNLWEKIMDEISKLKGT